MPPAIKQARKRSKWQEKEYRVLRTSTMGQKGLINALQHKV
jgi:hypothetical protein